VEEYFKSEIQDSRDCDDYDGNGGDGDGGGIHDGDGNDSDSDGSDGGGGDGGGGDGDGVDSSGNDGDCSGDSGDKFNWKKRGDERVYSMQNIPILQRVITHCDI